MKMCANWLFISLFIFCFTCCTAEPFRVANVYAENEMVLQMAPKSVHIWGWGEQGSVVFVTINSEHYMGETVDGKWSVMLPPQRAGGPIFLNIEYAPTSGQNQIKSFYVYFGDVWICSGQSNMEMQLKDIFNATEEIEKASTYTNIRIMKLTETTSEFELDELNSTVIPWSKVETPTVGDFSAACMLFGEHMADQRPGRPIGLIEASWPGTRIEAWSSTRVTTYCNTPPSTETNRNADNVLWNGMIKPLTFMSIRGAIWYQGENNAGYNLDYYSCHIQRLVEDWRNTFKEGNVPAENNVAFPFGIFQLGPTSGGRDDRWSMVRWHQSVDVGVLPNAYMPEAVMASSYDLTDRDSPTGPVHPRDKQTVVTRLANAVKTLLYNETYHMNGPVVTSVIEVTPGVVTLTYDTDIVVQATNGFSYLLPDGEWVQTEISGSSGREVTVTFDPSATHLAYGWTITVCEYKECAIYGSDEEALPAQIWLWDLEQIRNHRGK